MELILIRHFPTPGNGKKQYIGSTDEELDLSRIPEPLPAYPEVETIVSSPMKRCVQTAEILYPDKKKMLWTSFREMDFGDYEGKTYEELKDEPVYQKWLESGGFGAFPNGEDREDFVERCVQGTKELVAMLIEKQCQKTAVVVHGGVIMAMISAFDPEKRSFYDWQTENGNGYRVRFEPELWKGGNNQWECIKPLGII